MEKRLWEEFKSYKNVEFYIKKWQIWDEDDFGNVCGVNFSITNYDGGNGNIDLSNTLHGMPNEIVIRIATDLCIPTPGFLPIVPDKFKNILADVNQNACHNFERAIQNVYENPDESVTLAASVLDGIIKTILEHEKLQELKTETSGKSLGKQAQLITKRLSEMSSVECPQEIATLCGQLRSIGQTVDNLRSDKATAHGKLGEEYVINEPLWGALAVNACATVGIFLWELFNNKYKLTETKNVEVEENASGKINFDDIPF